MSKFKHEAGRVFHGALTATLECAGVDQNGRFRIRGVANTMKAMRSGRMFAPRAFDRFLSDNPRVDLALLAQHGMVEGYASIGRVDAMRVVAGQGLLFEGWIAQGTPLTDETRALVEQGVLRTVSLGWISKSDRIVRAGEPEIDPAIAGELERTGLDRVHAFFDVEPLELSAVDVPDDAGAKLAARAQDGTFAAITARLDKIEAHMGRLQVAHGHVEIAALIEVAERVLGEGVREFKNHLAMLVEQVGLAGDIAYAEAIEDALDHPGRGCGHGSADRNDFDDTDDDTPRTAEHGAQYAAARRAVDAIGSGHAC